MLARKAARISTGASKCCLSASSDEGMADKIYWVLADEELRVGMVGQGLQHSQQFSWDRAVQQTVCIYEELLSS